MNWTRRDVEDRLREALMTLRRVPGKGIYPSTKMVGWPDIVRSYWEAYNTEPQRKPRLLATARDLAEMDEVLGWIARWLNAAEARQAGLPDDVASIIWLRTAAVPWHKLVDHRLATWGHIGKRGGKSPIPGGNSYPTLRRAYDGGLQLLLQRLNGTPTGEPVVADARQWEYAVALDYTEESTVSMQDRKAVVRTRHARASWTLRQKRKGKDQ